MTLGFAQIPLVGLEAYGSELLKAAREGVLREPIQLGRATSPLAGQLRQPNAHSLAIGGRNRVEREVVEDDIEVILDE